MSLNSRPHEGGPAGLALNWEYINCEVIPPDLSDAVRDARAMRWIRGSSGVHTCLHEPTENSSLPGFRTPGFGVDAYGEHASRSSGSRRSPKALSRRCGPAVGGGCGEENDVRRGVRETVTRPA